MTDLKGAWKACYGWKRPIAKTKSGKFSLFLYLLALFFWVARFFWLIQPVKFLLRLAKGPDVDIHPLVVELYLIISVAFWCLGLFGFPELIDTHRKLSLALCCWAVFETISSNLYYLLWRPTLVRGSPPHNLYRSAIIAIVSYGQVLFILSVGWFAYTGMSPDALYYSAGPHDDRISYSAGHLNAVQSLYFVAVTTATLGYGDYSPNREDPYALLFALATLGVGVTMISVILARAVSLVPELPGS